MQELQAASGRGYQLPPMKYRSNEVSAAYDILPSLITTYKFKKEGKRRNGALDSNQQVFCSKENYNYRSMPHLRHLIFRYD